jgi:hypothetical protein
LKANCASANQLNALPHKHTAAFSQPYHFGEVEPEIVVDLALRTRTGHLTHGKPKGEVVGRSTKKIRLVSANEAGPCGRGIVTHP